MYERNCKKKGVNKSNHPIHSPLLLVTKLKTHDNMHSIMGAFMPLEDGVRKSVLTETATRV
jgi:5,10-methylenetetrahydrofolate reductase